MSPRSRRWVLLVFAISAFGSAAVGLYGTWAWFNALRTAPPEAAPPLTALWFFVGLSVGAAVAGAALLKLGRRPASR